MSIHNARRSGNALLAKWGGSLSLSSSRVLGMEKKKKKRDRSLFWGIAHIYIYLYTYTYKYIYTTERERETRFCIIVPDLITKSGDSIGPAVDPTPPAQPLLLRSVSSSIHPCFGSPVALHRPGQPTTNYVYSFIRVYTKAG